MTRSADVVDLHGAAAELGVGYHYLQSNWRSLEGFPPPFIGGGKRERPRWDVSVIREYRRGRRWPAGVATAAPLGAVPAANDPAQYTPPADPVSALLAAAGA